MTQVTWKTGQLEKLYNNSKAANIFIKKKWFEITEV